MKTNEGWVPARSGKEGERGRQSARDASLKGFKEPLLPFKGNTQRLGSFESSKGARLTDPLLDWIEAQPVSRLVNPERKG
ncbi:hypothetical protein G5I_08829 [Acromyrmex echinatior]|uniref:Uncharacterized protein n=1 Tax=Acromyrmex echinatior TaxID=103372 RepID=F4WSG9_ACREC|nr:hypothetical protein G5I_08829 [Acromyrmex echinatior]